MTVSLSTIGQIAITVADVSRAVEFYRDKLGMTFLYRAPNMAFFDCNGVRLMLGPSNESARTAIYYKVDDIDAAAAELKSRGVACHRDPHLVVHMPDHDLWMAFFRDPDDNVVALMSERKL
jgi:methylmalonyl-CoA/ethylmalonyl-CoA epimerase